MRRMHMVMPMKAAALLLCVLASVSAEDAVPDKFAGVATAEPAGTVRVSGRVLAR